MPELDIFDSDLTQRVFMIGSILFVALYAAAFLVLRGLARDRVGRVALHGRAAASALFIAAAVSAMAGGLGLFSTSSGAASQPASLSIGALYGAVDTRALPVQQVENPF